MNDKKLFDAKNLIITFLSAIVLILLIIIFSNSLETKKVNTAEDNFYASLNLTANEINAIDEMQKKTIKYGVLGENKVYSIVAEEIATAFGFETLPVTYDNMESMLEDVTSEYLDFTTNIMATPQNIIKFDFSTPILKYNLHYFYNEDKYNSETIENELISKEYVVNLGYPAGHAYSELIVEMYNEMYDVNLVAVEDSDAVYSLIMNGEIDIYIGDISKYFELGVMENIGITKLENMDIPFMHLVNRKDSNPYFISAVIKLLEDKEFSENLSRKTSNYENNVIYETLVERRKTRIFDTDKTYQFHIRELEPYAYYDENNNIVGLQVDVLEKIFDDYGLKYNIEFIDTSNSKSLIEITDYENYDIFLPSILAEETEDLYITSSTLRESKEVIVGLESENWENLTTIHDMYSYKIGILDNIFYDWYTKEHFYTQSNIVKYRNIEQIIRDLQRGTLDFAILPATTFNNYAYENSILDVEVVENISLEPMNFVYTFINNENNQILLKEFNIALENLDYTEILQKYEESGYTVKDLYETQTNVISTLAVVITVIFAFIIVLLTITTLRSNQKANIDILTKLYNSRKLKKYIEKHKFSKDMAIALIDIDNMKNINDIYGQSVGDKVIKRLGETMRSYNKSVVAFRQGGDEFIIIYNYKLFDLRDELTKLVNVYISIEEMDIRLEASVSIMNLSKYGYLSYTQVIEVLDYAMKYIKRNQKGEILNVDGDIIDEAFKLIKVRKAISRAVEQGSIENLIEPIMIDDNLCGGTLQPIFNVEGKQVDFGDFKVTIVDPKLLTDIGNIMFLNLCIAINQLNLKGVDTKKMIHIHDVQERKISLSDIEMWNSIMETYKIKSDNILFKVNPDIFKGKDGRQVALAFHNSNLEIVFQYAKIRGEVLVVLSGMERFIVEINTEILKNVISLIVGKTKEEIVEIFDNNLFIESQLNFINASKCEVLMIHDGSDEDLLLIEYYIQHIVNKKIYYSIRGNLQHLDAYISKV